MVHSLSRRGLIGGLMASVSATQARAQGIFGGGSSAPIDPNIRFRAIEVDASPIIDHGGAGVGARLTAVLGAELRKVFADRLSPGDRRASVLTARMTSVTLQPYIERTVRGLGFGNNDTIEGDGIISNGGRVLSTTHILTELPASYSGTNVTADVDTLQFQAISYQFAWWLRREMGL